MPELSRTFGVNEVSPAERQRLIRGVFQRVAPRYNLMNDLMSFGIHRLWKRTLVWAANPLASQTIVDLAGGTGDVARLLDGPRRTVIVCDPSLAMMEAGRGKAPEALMWLAGAGEGLPFADNAVDTLTIAFGIRNVTFIDAALREVLRVLRPGGRFLCLEFSRPWRPIRPLYDTYSRLVIPRLGALVARDPAAYSYLVESIRRFPDQEQMRAIMQQAGFVDVHYRNLTFGIACIHMGTRPDNEPVP